MDFTELAIAIVKTLTPGELFYIVALATFGYGLYKAFKRISEIVVDRTKINDKRNRDFYNINSKFDTYVTEHRNEHNQLNNRLGHLQNEVTEMRKDTTAIRECQIRQDAKIDVILEKYIRGKNDKS